MVIKIKNIFLTGRIQVGKSTLINKILAKFWGAFSGFRTLPYYDEYNQLNGFYLETLPQSLMLKELPFIGRRFEDNRWVGFPSVFEKLGTAILNECLIMKPDLFVMDELGFFESDALQFQGKVLEVLDSPIPVLGVLKQADVPFLNNIRKRDAHYCFRGKPELFI